jgi:DNA polymerase V
MRMLAVLPERATAPTVLPWWESDPGIPDAAIGWPLLATPVPAGFPSPADDRVERRLRLDAHLIRHPEATFLVRAAGDALVGAGIHDGDLLVVDHALPPTAGSIVVAVEDGAFALGRLGRDAAGRRILQSACPECPDRPLGDGRDLTIWGVVRWVIHRVWPGRDRVS